MNTTIFPIYEAQTYQYIQTQHVDDVQQRDMEEMNMHRHGRDYLG